MAKAKLDRTWFRELYDAGRNDAEMAATLGVKLNTVLRHRENLGLPVNGQNPRFDWTDVRVARLRDLAAQGLTTARIADSMGASSHSVYHAARRHGISITPSERGAAFSTAEDQCIIDGVLAGRFQRDIAADLGRTPGSVSMRIRRLRAAGRLPVEKRVAPPARPAAAPAEVRLPRVRMAGRSAPVAPAAPAPGPPREDRLARLSERFGAELVQAVVAIPRARSGGYEKLCAAADRCGVPITTAKAVWLQVAA